MICTTCAIAADSESELLHENCKGCDCQHHSVGTGRPVKEED